MDSVLAAVDDSQRSGDTADVTDSRKVIFNLKSRSTTQASLPWSDDLPRVSLNDCKESAPGLIGADIVCRGLRFRSILIEGNGALA
jgi:hypothetical protein